MSKDKDWPAHSDYVNGREFRAAKRSAIRRVLRELDELRLGIAYAPDEAYRQFLNAADALGKMKELISVKRWKR